MAIFPVWEFCYDNIFKTENDEMFVMCLFWIEKTRGVFNSIPKVVIMSPRVQSHIFEQRTIYIADLMYCDLDVFLSLTRW